MGRNLFLFFFSLVLVASSRLGIYQSRKERWSFSTNIILSMNSSKLFRASRNRISNPFKRGRIIARIVLFFDYSSHNYLLSVFGWKKKERKRKALLTGRNLCSMQGSIEIRRQGYRGNDISQGGSESGKIYFRRSVNKLEERRRQKLPPLPHSFQIVKYRS